MAVLAECPICHRKQATKRKKCKCGANLDNLKKNNTKESAKYKVRYWVQWYVPGEKNKKGEVGKVQKRELSGYSIDEAKALDGKRKAQKHENPNALQKQRTYRLTVTEIVNWYLGKGEIDGLTHEGVLNKTRYPQIEHNLNRFSEDYGFMPISNIKVAHLQQFQNRLLGEGLAPATVDDNLSSLRTMVKVAFDYEHVGGETLRVFQNSQIKRLMKGGANARNRVLSHDEFKAILEKLPVHLKPIFATGYYTGMRLGEILPLTWDKVDLQNRFIRLKAEDTKDAEARDIPIVDELFEILQNIPPALHIRNVFLYEGKPIKTLELRTLKKACEKAGVTYGRTVNGGFTFHDLRHTFNTNMRKAAVDRSVIMQITGHSTESMFRRYNTVDEADAEVEG
jgi:integrase